MPLQYEDIQVFYKIYLSDKDPPIYYGILTDELTGSVEVAVKRLSYNQNKKDLVKREIKVLLEIGKCPYIVKYKRHHLSPESDDLFLVMELCRSGSMVEYFEKGGTIPFEEKRNILAQLATGIEEIHRAGIVHGALKLSNVLQSKDGKCIKIGGFGLCKPAKEKTICITANFGYWGSPEHYESGMSRTNKSDIFSAGMIFHYVLSEGQHPYGKRKIIENIIEGKYKLRLETLPYRKVAEDLIKRMLQNAKESRPSAADVLRHPFLWEQSRKNRCVALVREYWQNLDSVLKKKLLEKILPSEDEISDQISDQELGDDCCLLLYILLSQNFGDSAEEFEDWKDEVSELQYNLQTFDKFAQCSELECIKLNDAITESEFEGALKELTNTMGEMKLDVYRKLQPDALPILDGKLVFEIEFDDVVKQQVVVKLVEQTDENKMAIEVFRDCSEKIDTVVEMKRSIKDFIYRTHKMFCIAMEPCARAPMLELISLNYVPISKRINLAVHIISAVLGIHRIGAIHGNIRPEKFLLTKNVSRVKMLGSRKMKNSTSRQERSKDLRSIAKLLCKLLNKNIENVDYGNVEDFERLEEATETSICVDKRLFIDLLKRLWNENGETENLLIHPFFWGPDRKLDFWIDVYKIFEAGHLQQLKDIPNVENWFDTLKLTDDERAKWCENDEFGTAYDKVTKGNAKYDNNSSVSLIKLIRNFGSHPHDMINQHKKKENLQGEQTLFSDKKSVGKFFYDRFSDLFYDVYKVVPESNSNEDRLANYFQETAQKHELKLGSCHPTTDQGSSVPNAPEEL